MNNLGHSGSVAAEINRYLALPVDLEVEFFFPIVLLNIDIELDGCTVESLKGI